MNILLVGSGGREHALAWTLAQSPSLTKLWAVPGNPGIAEHASSVTIDVRDHAAMSAFAKSERIDLMIIGPEAPLVDGLADSLRAGGIAVFGPSRAAARLEGSKNFTKQLCAEFGIPTAAYESHDDYTAAIAALDRFSLPIVVKADGLAAGKGVTVAITCAEAEAALAAIFAEPGAQVVIEAFLEGEEVSLFVISDGTTIIPFGTAQDHKRVGDGDTGPNTGGMGAYSPASVLTPDLEERAMAEIIRPTITAMTARGTPFVGVLYAGLMLTPMGPQLIEYNVRLGDPEAQVLLQRFDGDLAVLFHAAAMGKLKGNVAHFRDTSAVAVVLAAPDYPQAPVLGGQIEGLAAAREEAQIFLAGVGTGDTVSGGRVLASVGVARDFAEARSIAYRGLAKIDLQGGFARSDIGWREMARLGLTATPPVSD